MKTFGENVKYQYLLIVNHDKLPRIVWGEIVILQMIIKCP